MIGTLSIALVVLLAGASIGDSLFGQRRDNHGQYRESRTKQVERLLYAVLCVVAGAYILTVF